jgi:hypothetical protein
MTSPGPGYVPTQSTPGRRLPGYGLWVLVSGALLYGVVKTVDTSAALFTGG